METYFSSVLVFPTKTKTCQDLWYIMGFIRIIIKNRLEWSILLLTVCGWFAMTSGYESQRAAMFVLETVCGRVDPSKKWARLLLNEIKRSTHSRCGLLDIPPTKQHSISNLHYVHLDFNYFQLMLFTQHWKVPLH